MRRAVVILMIVLLILMLMSDIDVINFLSESTVQRENIRKYSYFHYLILSKFAYEVSYFRLMLTISLIAFWGLQVWKPISPLLLKRCTSYYVGLYLIILFIVGSAVPIIFSSIGGGDVSLVENLSILINSIGYVNILRFYGVIILYALSMLVLPVVYVRLVNNYSKEKLGSE